jgi:hypothetical protein
MTEAERCKEKIAEARSHPGLAEAMRTPPPTWLTTAIILTLVMGGAWMVSLAVMPSDRDLDRLPSVFRVQMIVAWIPTIGATIACVWLLFDAIVLAAAPTRYLLAVAEQRMHTPGPFYIRLITEGRRGLSRRRA